MGVVGLADAIEAHGDQHVIAHGVFQKGLVQQQAVGGELEVESAGLAPFHLSSFLHQGADAIFEEQRLTTEEHDAARAVRHV